MLTLAAMPDPRALPLYLAALNDRSPEVRRSAESALLAVRDTARPDLEKAARSGKFSGWAAIFLERAVSDFSPVTDWKVIGPFPRTNASLFLTDASIDFSKVHAGAEGRSVSWAPRRGDSGTGRVVLDDLKDGASDRGGFGYDANGSPDLCAFASAEIESPADRDALWQFGSSGTLMVFLNGQWVHSFQDLAGRAYRPDTDLVRIHLKKGTNRLTLLTRQGMGTWSFSVQVARPSGTVMAAGSNTTGPDAFRAFAATHEGDPRSGEAIFFDAKGVGCVKCHSAGGKGTATVGPDLTGLALKYDRAEIIRSVLEPSARIANGYQPVVLATAAGQVLRGLVRGETDREIELVDADGKTARVRKDEVVERKAGDVSLMPAGVTETLSLVEFADLISYLQSLKTPAAPPATAIGPAPVVR
jgi:putative heme-binding domain-containing protein